MKKAGLSVLLLSLFLFSVFMISSIIFVSASGASCSCGGSYNAPNCAGTLTASDCYTSSAGLCICTFDCDNYQGCPEGQKPGQPDAWMCFQNGWDYGCSSGGSTSSSCTPPSNTASGDHCGQDWIITSNTIVAGDHYNIKNFIVNPGVTATIKPATVKPFIGVKYGSLEIHAQNINIQGTLDGSAAGYGGGGGGGGGASDSGWSGSEQETGGAGGAGVVGGANGVKGSDSLHYQAQGGNGGKGGGSYGGAGGIGGFVAGNPVHGVGGGFGGIGGYLASGTNGDNSIDESVAMGGGGGGAGGGSGASAETMSDSAGGGGGGGAGAMGGGSIKLYAANRIDVSGNILSKGGNSAGIGAVGASGCNVCDFMGRGGAGGNAASAGTTSGGIGGNHPCYGTSIGACGNHPTNYNFFGGNGGAGGVGAGGGILISAVNINIGITATIDNRGGANTITNGGTLKVICGSGSQIMDTTKLQSTTGRLYQSGSCTGVTPPQFDSGWIYFNTQVGCCQEGCGGTCCVIQGGFCDSKAAGKQCLASGFGSDWIRKMNSCADNHYKFLAGGYGTSTSPYYSNILDNAGIGKTAAIPTTGDYYLSVIAKRDGANQPLILGINDWGAGTSRNVWLISNDNSVSYRACTFRNKFSFNTNPAQVWTTSFSSIRGSYHASRFKITSSVPDDVNYYCEDGAPIVHCTPTNGGVEICDGIDNDCNGAVDDGLYNYTVCNQAGACEGSRQTCSAGKWSACSILPKNETCDGVDNNCDGRVDEPVNITRPSLNEIPKTEISGTSGDPYGGCDVNSLNHVCGSCEQGYCDCSTKNDCGKCRYSCLAVDNDLGSSWGSWESRDGDNCGKGNGHPGCYVRVDFKTPKNLSQIVLHQIAPPRSMQVYFGTKKVYDGAGSNLMTIADNSPKLTSYIIIQQTTPIAGGGWWLIPEIYFYEGSQVQLPDPCYSCQNRNYFDVGGRFYCFDFRTGDKTAADDRCSALTTNKGYLTNYTDGETTANILEIINRYLQVIPKQPLTNNARGLFIDSTCNQMLAAFNSNSSIYFSGSQIAANNCANPNLAHIASGLPASSYGTIGNVATNSSNQGAVCELTYPFIEGCNATQETCNNKDDDCNGLIDDGVYDSSGCVQLGACNGSTRACSAGAWQNCSILPQTETANHIDDNCDGTVDEGFFYPGIIVQSPTLPFYNNTTLPLNITLTENGTWCGYSLDGQAVVNMDKANPLTFNSVVSGLTETTHSITFTCNDTDNWQNSTTVNFEVDLTLPVVSISYPGAANLHKLDYLRTNSSGYLQLFRVIDIDVYAQRVTIKDFNTESNQELLFTGSSVGSTADLTLYDGSHTTITLVNNDSLYPAISIDRAEAVYQTPVTTLNFSVFDKNLVECRYFTNHGATETQINCSENLTGLTSVEGDNVWGIGAKDAAGNIKYTEVTFFVDTNIPVVNITYPEKNDDWFGDISMKLNFTITSNFMPTDCWWTNDSGATTHNFPCPSSGSIAPIGAWNENTNTVTLYARGMSGLTGSDTRTFNIDSKAPEITILNPIPADIVGWDVILRARVIDQNINSNGVNFEIINGTDGNVLASGVMNDIGGNVYNATWRTNGEWPYNSSLLKSMNLKLIVYANDILGHLSNASSSFVLDNSIPSIQFVTPTPAGSYVNSDFNLDVRLQNHLLNYSSFEIMDSSGTVIQNRSIDLASPSFTWDDPVSIAGLVEGATYNVTVFARDYSETNPNTNQKSTWFNVDRRSPDIEIVSPENRTYNTDCINIIITSTDPQAIINFTYNGTSYAYPYALQPCFNFSQDSNTITADVWDLAGNHNSTSKTFFVDSIIPVVHITWPVSGNWFDYANVPVNFTAADSNPITCEWTNNSGRDNHTVDCSAGVISGAIWDPGTNNIVVYAKDEVGNIGSDTVSIDVDTKYPYIVINSPQPGNYNHGFYEINFTLFEDFPDGCTFSDGTTMYNFSCTGNSDNIFKFNSTEGNNTWTIYAMDPANHINSSSVSFFVDTQTPDIWFEAPTPSGNINYSIVTVNVSAFDSVPSSGIQSLTIEMLDELGNPVIATSTAASPDNSNLAATYNLLNGTYTFSGRVCDNVGNCNSTSDGTNGVNRTINIDTTTFGISNISSPVNNSNYSYNNLYFNMTVSSPAIWCGYSLDNGAWIDLSNLSDVNFAADYFGMPDGNHNIVFMCNDSSGNSATSSTIYFYVDATGPIVNITSPLEGTISNIEEILVSMTAEDPSGVSAIWWYYDVTGQNIIYNDSQSYNFTDGPHLITAHASDSLGNVGTANRTFLVYLPRTIQNSTIYGEYYPLNITSHVKNTTVVNSTINESTVDTDSNIIANITQSYILNSTMINVEVIDHCTIIDSYMYGGVCYYSWINGSYIINSTIWNSTVINSTLTNTTIINSTINDSIINDTVVINSSVIHSIITVDPVVIDALIINNMLYCGVIIFNETTTFDTHNCTTPINLTDVVDYPPVAALQVSPLSAYVGDTITFDGSGSYDWNVASSLNDSLTYEFNFGDGIITNSSNPVITHVYAAQGSYIATLTVIDSFGKSSSIAGMLAPLTIQTAPVTPPPGGFTGGGGGTAGVSVAGSNYVYKPTIEELLKGYNVVLKIRDMVRFMVLPDIYYLKVNSLSKTSMGIGYDPTLMVDSLKTGDDKLYEFNGDEFNDIQLQVHFQNETEANITIRLLLKPGEDISSLIQQMEQKQSEIVTQQSKISPTTIIVGALIVVIAALVIAVIAAYVRRKRMARAVIR